MDQARSEVDKQRILKGRTEQEYVEYYNKYIIELLDRLDRANQRIISEFEDIPLPPENTAAKPAVQKKKEKFYISSHTRRKYLHEIGASEDMIKRILHPKKAKKKYGDVQYTIYKPSSYGKLSNFFFEGTTLNITKKYPKLFDNLYRAIRSSDIRVLSKTYVSMSFFTSFLSFIVFAAIGLALNFVFNTPIPFTLASTLLGSIVLSMVVFGIFFLYPSMVVGSRNRMIKNDLPFVIIHMAAVAGSGAKPLSMFKLIASSGEYRGLEAEIKKILNYVNLFGYNISTALKTVATTTPSPRFRDLLTGMVATIESGGSLKSYLNSMAQDAMHTYSLERKKYVEVLSTYSDIYTGILIAAPLLFIVTLAIINLLGGDIAGVSVKVIALLGTYLVIPLLNIFFLLFLNITQPEI